MMMTASTVQFTSACLWLFALLEVASAQEVANNSQRKGVHVSTTGSPFLTKAAYIRLRRASANELSSFCLAPPQPANGEYTLDQYFCHDIANCKVPEGASLEPGSQLVYRCNNGYKATGNHDVYCKARGKWSAIPNCTEVKCDSLNSLSTAVSCSRFGEEVNCNSPVLPETRAEVTCRRGYKKDTEFVTTRKGVVNCNMDGKWEPQQIRCVPVCGVATTYEQPFVYGGAPAKIGNFPWHASLYAETGSSSRSNKVFLCGATVIQTNLLLTAAHCVYDERIKTTTDPAKLFVITGNIFRDYDSPAHNSDIVRKAMVKNVYTFCNYYGLTGYYASDIALVELQQPFEFSSILLPACLDDSEYRDQFLESGVYGRVAGFGKTERGTISAILQTITVPYISYSQCRGPNNAAEAVPFISSDKFCAGYNNGSAVCEGDSGGGLVFKKGELWFVMGIVSIGLGVDTSNGETTCDKSSYSLYTKVSTYIDWIQDVLLYVESKQRYPSCCKDSQTSSANATTQTITSPPNIIPNNAPTSLTSSLPYSCSAPPQLINGERKLHQEYCEEDSGMDCNISPGTKVKSGSQLVYRCASGFITNGTTDVYCLDSGEWTPLPICVGNFCNLSNGTLGACTLLKDCQPLSEKLKVGGPSDQQCGSSGVERVVCCHIGPPMVTPPHTEDTVNDRRGVIARQKCMEWSRYVSTSTCPALVNDNEQPSDPPGPFGKTRAGRMEFPHMAAIGFDLTDGSIGWYCGGTLISEIFVMTSVWCSSVYNKVIKSSWVRLGDLNLARSDDGANPEVRRIAERILHPDHKYGAVYNDIALLRLDSPVSFNDWIRPACLHTAPTLTGTPEAVMTGWGYLNLSKPLQSDDLMKVTLPIVDLQTCSEKFINFTRNGYGIDDEQMICAGTKGKSPCRGDSGGPLVIHNMENRCMYDVIGITFYMKFCGGEIPSISTRVYHYVPWIESIVWKDG